MNFTRISNVLIIFFLASTLHLSLAAPTRDPDLDDDSDIDLGDTSNLPAEAGPDNLYPDPDNSYPDPDDSYPDGDDSYPYYGDSYGGDADYTFESYGCDNGEREIDITQLCDRIRDCDDGSDEFLETCQSHGVEVDNEDDFTKLWVEPTAIATTTATPNTQPAETTWESEVRHAGTGDYDPYYYDYGSCLENEYQCSDFVCISRAALCDGFYDCGDGGDEEDCHGNQEESTTNLPTVTTVTTARSSHAFGHITTTTSLITEHTVDGSADYTKESSTTHETTTWRPQDTTGQATATTLVDTTVTSEDTTTVGYETSTTSSIPVSTTKVNPPETTTISTANVTRQTETALSSSSTFTTEHTTLNATTPEYLILDTTETNHNYATTKESFVMTNDASTTSLSATTKKNVSTTASVVTMSHIPESTPTFTETSSPTPITDRKITRFQSTTSAIQATSTHLDLCADEDRFQCRSRVGDCISRDMLCDGFVDCDDGSDEADCSCQRGSDFECINNRCIDASLRCDGFDDCGDMSDEIIGCIVDPGIRIITRPEVTQTTENNANQTSTQTATTHPMTTTSSTTKSHEKTVISVITLCPSGYTCFNGGLCTWTNRGEETCRCPEGVTGNYCERIVGKADLDENIDLPCGSAASVGLNSFQLFMLILSTLLTVTINCEVITL